MSMSSLFPARRLFAYQTPLKRRWQSSNSSPPQQQQKSPHSQWYANVVPAMIPIFLLGSAVYLGLQLGHLKLTHEKYMEEAQERVRQLEATVEQLREERLKQEERAPVAPGTLVQTTNKSRSWW